MLLLICRRAPGGCRCGDEKCTPGGYVGVLFIVRIGIGCRGFRKIGR
jgi:hypothetical protein